MSAPHHAILSSFGVGYARTVALRTMPKFGAAPRIAQNKSFSEVSVLEKERVRTCPSAVTILKERMLSTPKPNCPCKLPYPPPSSTPRVPAQLQFPVWISTPAESAAAMVWATRAPAAMVAVCLSSDIATVLSAAMLMMTTAWEGKVDQPEPLDCARKGRECAMQCWTFWW